MKLRDAKNVTFRAKSQAEAEAQLAKLDKNLFWITTVVFDVVNAYGFPTAKSIPQGMMTQPGTQLGAWHNGRWYPLDAKKVQRQQQKDQEAADRATYGRDS